MPTVRHNLVTRQQPPKASLLRAVFVCLLQNLGQFSNPNQERNCSEKSIMLCVPLNCKTFNKMPSIENLDSEPKMANKVFFPLSSIKI